MSTKILTLKYGDLYGSQDILPGTNQPFYFFRGIPYAEPPIGKLRFQPPRPLKVFPDSLLDCTKERNVAPQKDMFSSEYIGTEDCLFLNVYTPNPDTLHPVMVFIHGGGFNCGSGNSDLYSPEYLVREGVVVVTLNYRLGPLGFLHLPSVGIHGNMGLKDQQLALEWVKKNIESFGGDCNNITVFGESAGAASTYFHLFNERSKMCFNKAIVQSGSVFNDWCLQIEPEVKAVKLAQELGCGSTKPRDILGTLMTANALEMTRFANRTLTADEKRRGLPMQFRPVVEVPNTTALVTEHPWKSMLTKDLFNGIPVIAGVTSMEGMVNLKNAIVNQKKWNDDVIKYIPMSMNITPDSYLSNIVGNEIKEFYFGKKPFTEANKDKMCQFLTDYDFHIQHYATVELISKFQQSSPLFLYRFSFDGKLNLFKKLFGDEAIKGACHVDDLCYLFLMRMIDVSVEDTSPEGKVRSLMCKLWTNFAKYGNPTPVDPKSRSWVDAIKTVLHLGKSEPLIWEQVKPSKPSAANVKLPCLDIDEVPKMVLNPDKERMDFWKATYKRWNEGFIKPKL